MGIHKRKILKTPRKEVKLRKKESKHDLDQEKQVRKQDLDQEKQVRKQDLDQEKKRENTILTQKNESNHDQVAKEKKRVYDLPFFFYKFLPQEWFTNTRLTGH